MKKLQKTLVNFIGLLTMGSSSSIFPLAQFYGTSKCKVEAKCQKISNVNSLRSMGLVNIAESEDHEICRNSSPIYPVR